MADSSGPKWTNEQRIGIETTDKSLLVSAAAGSGKTAVLAERCVYLVCDAPQKCEVDELLVVTFTEAAAAEMRGRIQDGLRKRIEKEKSDRLTRQMALVEHAQISTLHGFCATLLRQYFHRLDLDPNFTVLDGEEAKLLRAEIARDLLARRYEEDSSGQFQSFIDAYCDGYDERLVSQITRSHEMLCSLVDPKDWLDRARRRIQDACNNSLDKSEMGRELLAIIELRLEEIDRRCADAIAAISRMSGFAKYLTMLQEIEAIVKHLRGVMQSDGLDALVSESQVSWPKLPSISNDTPGKAVAAAMVDSVRGELKDGKLKELLSFTSQQWLDGLGLMSAHAEMFIELLAQFAARYRAEKQAARVVDFSDLEQLALRALREGLSPSAVARLQHARFKQVLVDEYQDINEVQDAILNLVSRECLCDGAPTNLFCVGDVKQSIYRFRLADPQQFLRRQEMFKISDAVGINVDLQKNFRSREPLLKAINEIFRHLMTKVAAEIEYDTSHYLTYGADYPAQKSNCFSGAPIELHLLPDKIDADAHNTADDEMEPERAEREAILIVQRINEFMKSKQVIEKQPDGSFTSRAIRHGDIVILLRSMKFKADQYAEVLRRSGIPVHSESGSGFFESMEVRDVLALLSLLDNQRQDIPLAAVLRSPLAMLPEPEDNLARVRMAYKDLPFHEAVVNYAAEQNDALAAKLKDFLDDLKKWRDMAQRRPLAEVIWKIYHESGYLAFCEGLIDGQQRKANLLDLHERARQFGTFQRQGLARFLRFLENLQTESDLGTPSIAAQAEDVVRIMSVHRSKGLEFPVVILPDLGKKMNLSDCSGSILLDRQALLGMSVVDETLRIRYPSLASVLVRERLLRQSLAEELRVLYVAMTRAREHLILIGTCKASAEEEWTNLWSGRDDAFPADMVLGARRMIDWIGPVAAAMKSQKSPGISIISHSADEVAAWRDPEAIRPPKNDRLENYAKLEILSPAPARSDQADAIIARLTSTYPFDALTKLKAVESATSIAKQDQPTGDTPSLKLPHSVSTISTLDAADVGTATHLVLEHLNFAARCDADDLKKQIDDLLARRIIAPIEAEAVDVDAICWMMNEPIGALFRKNAATLRREVAINFMRPPEQFGVSIGAGTPADSVMIRGRIDVLVVTSGGLEIIDYKTDRVTSETIDARCTAYASQLNMYARAIADITRKQVTKAHLVFLAARQVRNCPIV